MDGFQGTRLGTGFRGSSIASTGCKNSLRLASKSFRVALRRLRGCPEIQGARVRPPLFDVGGTSGPRARAPPGPPGSPGMRKALSSGLGCKDMGFGDCGFELRR